MVCTQRALQEEADNALDMAETATAALEEEKAQLILQSEELLQQLAVERDTQRASAIYSQSMATDSQVLRTLNACCPLSMECQALESDARWRNCHYHL